MQFCNTLATNVLYLSASIVIHATLPRFAELANGLFAKQGQPIRVSRIDGKMKTSDRKACLDVFREAAGRVILANARVLQEAVDVPV